MPSVPPFRSIKDFLQISTNTRREGLDYDNLRDVFISNKDMKYTDVYTHPVTKKKVKGEWYLDEGYEVMPKEYRESRHYCIKGMAEFTFTGTSLIMRLMLDSGQGTAEVFIDGKTPSTIPGVKNAVDKLDCDLDNYNLGEGAQSQYHDVLVAENLTDGAHTCTICANNAAGVYFLISGAKVRAYRMTQVFKQGYHEEARSGLNDIDLRFTNEGEKIIRNLTLYFPIRCINRETGRPFPAPYVIPRLESGAAVTFNSRVDGLDYADALDLSVTYSAEYIDDAGAIEGDIETVTVLPDDPRLKFSEGWDVDTAGIEGAATLSAYTNKAGASCEFHSTARKITLVCQCDWGYGILGVYADGVRVGAFDLWSYGSTVITTRTVDNFPPGEKLIRLVVETRPGQDNTVLFTKILLEEKDRFTRVEETIPIRMTFDYIKPYGITGLKLDKRNEYFWNPIAYQRHDYTIPRTNRKVKEAHIMRRFATFALNYSDKGHEQLKYYDLIIVDPGTVTRREVAQWQKLGIKVFGYVSFGEEDGILIDPWDTKSKKTAHKDDGKGPGGYASYYCKGGYGYAEHNQCAHDAIRETGEKKCLLGDSHYFSGVGCCTCVCKHDTREGYTAFSEGETCGGGYTKKNYWKRTGDEACTNSKCPKYTPYHGNCPHYEHADGWGQDLNYTTPDYPDQNGIWGSSYINPLAPRWKEKLSTFYLRRVFGLPKRLEETVKLSAYRTPSTKTLYTFTVGRTPILESRPVKIWDKEGRELSAGRYRYNAKTGVFDVEPNAAEEYGGKLYDGMRIDVGYSIEITVPGGWGNPGKIKIPKEIKEEHTLKGYEVPTELISYVFRSAEYPIDKDEAVHLYTKAGKEFNPITYNFDPTTGAFQIDESAAEELGMKLHEGMEIVASYHVVGMGADGVFMDTLDTVDVYPAEEFGEGMAKMVNELKAEYPGKEFIANRGFTILPQIIRSCAYVMFETFISEYDWNTGKYYELTDKDTVKENEEVKKKLRELRKAHTFDILALNYCADGAEGDALREKIAQTCYAEGYLSWSANIMLDNVLLPHHVKSDAWKGNVKPGNPFFSSMPAVEIACAVREQNNVKVWGEPIESTRLWRRYESVNRDEWYEIRWYEVKSFFAEEVTTMAWCFLLELKDGTRMGFTSCDIDLEIDGVIYEACAGFAPTAVATSNDMAVDNLDVEGTVSSERIDEADIYAGRYDNAKITIFICDYERPAMSFIMRRGTIGKLTSGKTSFKAEIRGLLDPYQRKACSIFQRTCRAKLGDAQCKIALGDYTKSGAVTIVNNDGSFHTDITGATENLYEYGVLRFTSGKNTGAAFEVEKFAVRGGMFWLFSEPLNVINIGDTFTVSAGCNGQPSTCRNKFKNFVNFRGEPYIPGNDFVVTHPLKAGENIVPEGAPVRLKANIFGGA